MSQIQLKDLRNSNTHQIDIRGAVFGRESADILVSDRSVSKRHARVYAKNGRWYLEDLGSSNGTFFDGEKITGPIVLQEGDVFSLGAYKFEVAQILSEEEVEAADNEKPEEERPTRTHSRLAVEDESESTEGADLPPAKSGSPGRKEQDEEPADETSSESEDASGEEQKDVEAEEPLAKQKPARSKPLKATNVKAAGTKGTGTKPAGTKPAGTKASGTSTPPADVKSVAYYLTAVPKAVAYYLVVIPMLVLNPMGTVRKGVEEPKLPAMGPPELIAYALPVQLFMAVVGFLCTLIVLLIKGGLSLGSIIPIVPLVMAVVVSVASGFLFHPVMKWLVGKLNGEADDVQLSNMFVMINAASALAVIPGGLGTLLGLIPFPLLLLLPVLLQLAATLIITFATWRWFTSFNVVRWFTHGILGLGALACIWSAWASLGLVVATFKSLGSSSSASHVAAPAAADKPAAEPEQKADAKDKDDADKKADATIKAALDKTKPAGGEAKAAADETKPRPADEEADTPKDDGKKSKKGKKDVVKDEAAAGGGKDASDYRTYMQLREEIEKALAENPFLLRTADVRNLYEQLHRTTYEVRHKKEPGKKKDKDKDKEDPALAPVQERLKDIEVFERTRNLVSQLHAKLKL